MKTHSILVYQEDRFTKVIEVEDYSEKEALQIAETDMLGQDLSTERNTFEGSTKTFEICSQELANAPTKPSDKPKRLIDLGINVATDGKGSGSISSNLHCNGSDLSDMEYNAAIDGLESLILACACAGIDVNSSNFVEAVQTAIDGIGNKF